MARTDVHGITIDRLGRRTIDKAHRGERIFARLGAISQEQAERLLAKEIDRIEWERERRMHARPLFSDCAKRFLRESKHKRSVTTLAWHIELLLLVDDNHLGRLTTTILAGRALPPGALG